jgi:hypothetical protein
MMALSDALVKTQCHLGSTFSAICASDADPGTSLGSIFRKNRKTTSVVSQVTSSCTETRKKVLENRVGSSWSAKLPED